MSLSKATPRGVTPIVPTGGFSAPAVTGVIPIRGMTPPSPAQAVTAPDALARRPRVRSVPVEQRPWRVLLVPPTPGARTRAFDLARWQARLILSAVAVLLLIAAGAVTTVIVALDSPDLLATSAEMASLRNRLNAVEDSLASARAVLSDSENVPADSSIVARAPTKHPRIAVRAGTRTPPRMHVRSPVSARLSIEGLPVIGAIMSGFSNARRHPILHILRPHLGVDIAAVRGTRVAAPAAGRVTYVGRKFAYGLTVEIEHAGGITTRYAHLRAALVRAGQPVARGGAIATVGSSGLTSGPHLHYEVAVNGQQVDPLRFRIPQLSDSTSMSASPPAPPSVGAGAPATHDESGGPNAAVPR